MDSNMSEDKDSKLQHTTNGDYKPIIEEDVDTQCGLFGFRPRSCQGFARIGAFIGVYSIAGLLTSSLTVYVNSQVSMLEKQFGFSSSETGLLMSCNDIGFLTTIVFAGYIARKIHIPRGLGISTILYGVCGVLCALPYFIQDRSMYALTSTSSTDGVQSNFTKRFSSKQVPMCLANDSATLSEKDACSEENSKEIVEQVWIKNVAFWLLAIGMVLQGIGKSPRYPFTTLYIDDNVDKRKTGFYMGILTGTGIFGPALAYLLGGLFSKIYVTLEDVDITPADPRWIGAWWLGFLVFGMCAIVFSFPIMCFPRKMRSKRGQNEDLAMEEKHTKHPKITENVTKRVVNHEIKEFLKSVLRLFKNPVYCMLVISVCVNILGVAGIISFLPKYLANQYNIPLWQANIVMAISNVTAVSLGSFIGGVISRCVNMTPRKTFVIMFFFFSFKLLSYILGLFLGCDQPIVIGDNGKGDMSNFYNQIETPCLDGCTCMDEKYFPICGEDGNSYFSPCHAGCSVQNAMSFTNCTCIPSGRATAGVCDQGCTVKLFVYAAVTFIGKLFTAFKIIPTIMATLRSVKSEDRAVATAVGGFLYSVIGWMPGPVIFGRIIDAACSLWKYTCGVRQSCLLYDTVYFRNAVHGFAATATFASMLVIACIYIYLRVKGFTEWSHISGEELDLKHPKGKHTKPEEEETIK